MLNSWKSEAFKQLRTSAADSSSSSAAPMTCANVAEHNKEGAPQDAASKKGETDGEELDGQHDEEDEDEDAPTPAKPMLNAKAVSESMSVAPQHSPQTKRRWQGFT